ncbi:hypothetical protein M5K25_009149 [Dendrobium thyrsiflorum]|uniref:Uncharacterized protein n=1 Tax=Dendrobium thyrsiflorum TaxID=117978 RepID=A0ABD0V514_DENTH
MVRRSARCSSLRSGEGSGGSKASRNGNFWKILEGQHLDLSLYELKQAGENEVGKVLCSSVQARDLVASPAISRPATDGAFDLSNGGDIVGVKILLMWQFRISQNLLTALQVFTQMYLKKLLLGMSKLLLYNNPLSIPLALNLAKNSPMYGIRWM